MTKVTIKPLSTPNTYELTGKGRYILSEATVNGLRYYCFKNTDNSSMTLLGIHDAANYQEAATWFVQNHLNATLVCETLTTDFKADLAFVFSWRDTYINLIADITVVNNEASISFYKNNLLITYEQFVECFTSRNSPSQLYKSFLPAQGSNYFMIGPDHYFMITDKQIRIVKNQEYNIWATYTNNPQK